MLELRGVCKTYGSLQAVAPTDLTIPAGSTTALIGPSGSGKSTLLRLMIGLVRPDDGSVWLDGARLGSDNVLELRRRMGYVIQDGGLFPHLTARANVELVARWLGRGDAERRQRLQELAELTHFPVDGLDRYPAQLSGGQQQRVGLMRALMLDPDVLLLDEPLAALDPMIRAELQHDLRGIFRHLDKTVVLVTHDLAEASYFAETIVLLRQGRVVQQGTFAGLRDRPADPFVVDFVTAQRTTHELAPEGQGSGGGGPAPDGSAGERERAGAPTAGDARAGGASDGKGVGPPEEGQ